MDDVNKFGELNKKITIDRIKEMNCTLFCSGSMKEILSSYIGFIKDNEFRRELVFYLILLNSYENEVNRFVREGFNDDMDAELKWITNMLDVSVRLTAISTKFLVNIDKLMTNEGNQEKPLVFKTALPNETYLELSAKIFSRDALYVQNFEEKAKKAVKNSVVH
jgi:hypothetical protein